MLSFFATGPFLKPFTENSCHLLFPASSSLFALTFRGTLAGRAGPSPTLLGSRFAWLARSGSMLAAAEMTPVCDCVGVELPEDGVAASASALRLRESPKGLMSCAESVSVVAYDLKVTM